MKKNAASFLFVLFVLFSFIITSCSAQRAAKTNASADSVAKKSSEFDLSFLDKTSESYVDPSGNLSIADPVLKAKIEQKLGLTGNSKIPLSAVEAITMLELGSSYEAPDNQKIHNIDALAFFKNLNYLNIKLNSIKNISPLRDLKNLNVIYAQNNRIQDISPLKDLKNLQKLDLYMNQVSDISVLSELTELTELNLWSNGIQRINALNGLKKLTYLNIGGNLIKDLSPIIDCKLISTLWLNSNPLVNPEVISKMGQNLVTLSIAVCNISDISFLENCPKLGSLMMFNNTIKDISGLRNCRSLNVVFAANNQIENIDVLAVLAEKGAFQKPSSYQDQALKTRLNIDISNNRIDYTLEKNLKIKAYLNEKVSGVKF